MRMAAWPTPKAAAAGPDFAKIERSDTGPSLQTVMAGTSYWSTPRASDGEKGAPLQQFSGGGQPLPAQMYANSPNANTTEPAPLPTTARFQDDAQGAHGDAEIAEAVHYAKLESGWSVHLAGLQVNYDEFAREVERTAAFLATNGVESV